MAVATGEEKSEDDRPKAREKKKEKRTRRDRIDRLNSFRAPY
jgi:hypothetical protein